MIKTDGHKLIAVERQRQIDVEGWSLGHDDSHGAGVLELAALCYRDAADQHAKLPAQWPWDVSWWKPKGRQSNLVRAGALYQAAADAAWRASNYQSREKLQAQVETCANLINSLQPEPPSSGWT